MKMQNYSASFLCMIIAAATIMIISACNKDNSTPTSVSVGFNATLDAAQETPPTGESGTGTCVVTYDTVTNELKYTLTWDGLTGVPTAMHFHKADIGVAGGVEIPINGFAASVSGTLTSSAQVDQDDEHDLLEEKFYVNIHTAAHPGGEIRGQLLKQ
jgi:hypothetical protein